MAHRIESRPISASACFPVAAAIPSERPDRAKREAMNQSRLPLSRRKIWIDGKPLEGSHRHRSDCQVSRDHHARARRFAVD